MMKENTYYSDINRLNCCVTTISGQKVLCENPSHIKNAQAYKFVSGFKPISAMVELASSCGCFTNVISACTKNGAQVIGAYFDFNGAHIECIIKKNVLYTSISKGNNSMPLDICSKSKAIQDIVSFIAEN